MIIKNDHDLAKYIELPVERLEHCSLEHVDYATTLESDGYTVIMRMCDEDIPSKSSILAYPFTDDEFDEKLISIQCFADHLAHEAKGKHGNYDGIVDNYDMPELLEDEIAEILHNHAGEEICIMRNPKDMLVQYACSKHEYNKDLVDKIYDALRRHYFVTVNGKNIIDL